MSTEWGIGRSPQGEFYDGGDTAVAAVFAAEKNARVLSGSYFLFDGNLEVDATVSAALSSAKFMKLAETTKHCYVQDLRLFFSFLARGGKRWDTATNEDLDDYGYLRTSSPDTARRVGRARWNREYSAIRKFYTVLPRGTSCAMEIHLMGPDSLNSTPSSRPREGAKWLSPARVKQWRDVGLRGFTWDGSEDLASRIRFSERNAAFVELLNGTGLRSAEAHHLTVLELPPMPEGKGTVQLALPALIAKGGTNGRAFYLDTRANSGLRLYIDYTRRAQITKANRLGLYEARMNKFVVSNLSPALDPLVTYQTPAGERAAKSLSKFSAFERMNLFTETSDGYEPLVVWLGESGFPLQKHSWLGIFAGANRRCDQLAPGPSQTIRCNPHMLRHGFAMRMLLLARRFLDRRYGADPKATRDFEAMYGPAISIVRDLLGHGSEEVTRLIYLAALRDLEVQQFMMEFEYDADEGSDFLEKLVTEKTGVIHW